MAEAYTGDYTALRAAATACMRDTCQIGVQAYVSGDDPGNVTYTYSTAIPCGLKATTQGELADGSQATLTTAELRVPWGTSIKSGDRVKMTTQAGVSLTTKLLYAVDGEPYQTLAAVRCKLKRITEDSVL